MRKPNAASRPYSSITSVRRGPTNGSANAPNSGGVKMPSKRMPCSCRSWMPKPCGTPSQQRRRVQGAGADDDRIGLDLQGSGVDDVALADRDSLHASAGVEPRAGVE